MMKLALYDNGNPKSVALYFAPLCRRLFLSLVFCLSLSGLQAQGTVIEIEDMGSRVPGLESIFPGLDKIVGYVDVYLRNKVRRCLGGILTLKLTASTPPNGFCPVGIDHQSTRAFPVPKQRKELKLSGS